MPMFLGRNRVEMGSSPVLSTIMYSSMRATIRGSHSSKEVVVKRLENYVSAPEPKIAMRRTVALRLATATCMMAVVVMSGVIAAISMVQVANGVGNRDSISYWTAGHLMLIGEDPYDASLTLKIEKSAGWTAEGFEIMRNPPVIFFLVAPLGLVSARTGEIIWLILLAASLLVSIRLLWIVLGRHENWLHLYCLCIPPVLACLSSGQLGIVLLLGVSLFLYLYARWPFLAGTALLVCAFKPHLFLPFGISLILWTVHRRQYRVFAGLAMAVLLSSFIALCIDPHSFSQYSRMMAVAQPTEHPFVPTLSKMFRLLLNPAIVWLQFVPAAAGCCWAAWYYLTKRGNWSWANEGLLLLVVSVGCAPYAWFTDEVLLVPAILAAVYRAEASGRSLLPFALISGILLAELCKGYWITTPYFLWSIPAWLSWYIYASRRQTLGQLQSERA
jgi:hypothetical protein